MSRRDEGASRTRRGHGILLLGLAALLLAFAAWCGVLLWRAHELRRDLDRRLASAEDVRELRGELDALRAEGGAGGVRELAERIAGRLDAEREDPELGVAVQGLRGALDRLERSLAAPERSPDDVWQAEVAARDALGALEGRFESRVAETYGRLGGLWQGLWLLAVATLVLAASNLALLRLAHRRRLRLEEAHHEALLRSTQDPLTRVWNREAILNLLRRELVRSRRVGSPLGVILADVDAFGELNALLGEDQGDYVLEQLASRLGSFVRPYDTMGRFGGDSFLIVLPVCDLRATGNVALRLAEAVNERDVEHALGRIRITVTIVYATVEKPEDADADLLIHHLEERIAALQAEGAGGLAGL